MAEFLQASKFTLKQEGGSSQVIGDHGEETYCGISRKNWPNWQGWAIVDANKPLDRNEVINSAELSNLVNLFYHNNFWQKINGDLIDSQKIAEFLFDWYVNSGAHATKALQTIIGVDADGAFGAHSVSVLNEANEDSVYSQFKQARVDFYNNIVQHDPSQQKFLKGWLNRVAQFAILLLLVFPFKSFAQDTLRHKYYTSVWDNQKHIPIVVYYNLDASMLNCKTKLPRTNKFVKDPLEPQSTDLSKAYHSSGYDQGHNMSAQDNACDQTAMVECFYYSNMFPQTPNLNRGVWKQLEVQERALAMKQPITVYIGSVGCSKTIGVDKVCVPDSCWKVIVTANDTASYIFPNGNNVFGKPEDYKTTNRFF